MNKRIRKKQIKMKNKKLCKRYPFLIPRNRWTDKPIWNKRIKTHDWWYSTPYSYTELDAMPEGWRKAFGEQMCEEIREDLIKHNFLNDYRILQIKEKYGCYDTQTEVLTKNGWKYFKDVTYEDEFATLDTDGQTLIYQKPTDIIAYNYEGEMYHLQFRGVDLLVTPNHNLYVAKGSYYDGRNGQCIKRTYPYELCDTTKYFQKPKRFNKGAKWIGVIPDEEFKIENMTRTRIFKNGSVENCIQTYHLPDFKCDMKNFLKFVGFYVAEGYSKYGNGSQVSIAYNPADEEELVTKLITDIGFESKPGGKGLKRFHHSTLARWLQDNCGHLAPNKKIPDFIKQLPPEYIELFLKYLFIGDGHQAKTSNILTTTSEQLCNDVCECLIKAGYSFSYAIRPPKDNGEIKGNYPHYDINWLKNTEVELGTSTINKTKSYIEQYELYNDMVYCVTIPNHILYIRRNGKGTWCGNSLRWYDGSTTKEIQHIISKYEEISERTCICCGRPAENHPIKVFGGWISPVCPRCEKEMEEKVRARRKRNKDK